MLKYRTDWEQRETQNYKDWYAWNFKRTHDIIKNVEDNLANIFDPQDKRAFDIWMDIPQNSENNYIDSHIEKLDKQLENMSRINAKVDSMAKTITNIDTIKRMSAEAQKPGIVYPAEFDYYNKKENFKYQESLAGKVGFRSGLKGSMSSLNVKEDVPQKFKKQRKFEKSVIGTLPQEYRDAKLIEITETSYLIRNEIKLPIFGKSVRMFEKEQNKKDISQLMQSLFWKKGWRPVSHSSIKEVEEEKQYFKEKDNEDLKTENENNEVPKPEEAENIHKKEDESLDHIEVEVPHPEDEDYNKIQDQNQAIKRLIITIDNIINTYDRPEKGPLEDLIREEIESEVLLSENERKTIEVLVLDYLSNGKSVLDLISLAKLEEDFKTQDFDEGEGKSENSSEVPQGTDILLRLPDTEKYMELIAQRVPNKYETITEIKYKIPMKWTKKFNVDDIVPHKEKLETAIQKEGGLVNNYMKRKKLKKKKVSERLSESVQPPNSQLQTGFMNEISTPQDTNPFRESESREIGGNKTAILNEEEIKEREKHNETDGFNQMKKPIFSNELGKTNVPLSNTMLKESLSSKHESPLNKAKESLTFPKSGHIEETKTLLQKHKQLVPLQPEMDKLPNIENLTEHDIVEDHINEIDFDHQQSQIDSPRTEIQYDNKSRDLASRGEPLDYSQIKPQFKPDPYNIQEIEHLFVEGKIPEEIYTIEDPMEYNYLLVKLKKEFNDQTRSEFLKYMNLQLPYNSRRDEVGGVITDEDWNDFVLRMGKMIKRVRRKRRRIIRRRKKRGKKLMPRKTLFKPKKRPNLAKDPLWWEVFLDEDSEDSTVEDTDILDFEDGFKIKEKKSKPKFFERKEKFELPQLYKPLVKGKIH